VVSTRRLSGSLYRGHSQLYCCVVHSRSTEIYTLSLHDALPIFEVTFSLDGLGLLGFEAAINRDYPLMFGTLYIFTLLGLVEMYRDRKSTRLNSSHVKISYAVFCLKKKKTRFPWGSTDFTAVGGT